MIPLWILNILGWLRVHWRWWVYPLIILSIFFTGYCGIQSCSKSKETKKELELRDDENEQKGELKILKEQEANANIQIEQAGQNSNIAGNNFNATLNRNSTEFDANYRRTRSHICADPAFRSDPACR